MEKNTNLENVIKQAGAKQKSLIFNFKKTYPAYIVLVIFIIGSFFARHFIKESVESSRQIEFDKATTSIASRVDNYYKLHRQVLQSMHGLYNENIEVVRDYFELYGTVPAKTYSSILSLSYVPYVKNADWEDFHFNARSQFAGISYNLQPAGARDYYYPILHIVLYDKNISRIGFDYATVGEMKATIEKARDNNALTASDVFDLRKDTSTFCLVMPVYARETDNSSPELRREHFQASVVLEIDTKEFFNSALRGTGEDFFPNDSTVVFDYIDVIDGSEVQIFKSGNYSLLESGYTPLLTSEIKLQIADKEFIGRFRTVPNFGGALQAYIPDISLAGSLLSSFLLFAFIISVITSRSRAEDLAERMTRSQRRILEATKDIIGVIDFNGHWKSVNPAVTDMLGYDIDSFVSTPFKDMMLDEKEYHFFENALNTAESEQTQKVDVQFKHNNGEPIWINWNLTISKADGLIYAIGRDVTLEKLAEREAEIKRKQIELAEQFALEASTSKSFFMMKLSHQLRNSLTGIIGYLQLLSNKFYETEEEQMEYLSLAEQSSEEIFTFVSDIVDAALEQGESSLDSFVNTKIEPTLRNALSEYIKDNGKESINFNIDAGEPTPTALVSPIMLERALKLTIEALIADMDNVEADVVVQSNPYEGASEIQMLGPGNAEIGELIELYRENQNNVIDIMKHDKNEVISNLAKSASLIRRMNGTMTAETLGGSEGNVIMITLPTVGKNQ